MNLPLLLLTSLLVPAALTMGAAVAGGAGGTPWYLAPIADAYGSRPGDGFVDSYGDRYVPLERMAPSGDVPGYYRDPGLAPATASESSYFGDHDAARADPRAPGDGLYRAGAESRGGLAGYAAYQGALYPGPAGDGSPNEADLRAFGQQPYGVEPPPRTVNGGPGYGDLPPARGPAYRFRGDERLGSAMLGGTDGGGWQFRPLTEQERSHTQFGDQWRPIRAVPGPQARPRVDERQGLAPGDAPFGYEPDNWFRRYYGDRP